MYLCLFVDLIFPTCLFFFSLPVSFSFFFSFLCRRAFVKHYCSFNLTFFAFSKGTMRVYFCARATYSVCGPRPLYRTDAGVLVRCVRELINYCHN
ncbi:hypothetical protein VNO78_08122 [Psophocarpus tetragonolobus]|uniref:Uncharacterized protein n=1 Tax=Psophocarpus tetragonolobus TaxID=3891 RepID=A0AAN9XSK0_PSOTE